MKIPKYMRIQGRDLAYRTQKPVGVFALGWRLIRNGALSQEDMDVFVATDNWFKDHLPQPPFYGDNNANPEGAITYFKVDVSDEMSNKLDPIMDILDKYSIPYDIVYTDFVGKIIYEDDFQVGVVATERQRSSSNG